MGIESYRNERKYPFCPGCGHGLILDGLNKALVKLQLDPKKVVLVSDIGCVGLSDQYFATSAFHGLHGRSVTYATGIKLVRPDLDVIVLMGDGGAGIGGHHLLNAARRNIGVKVILFNNFNFGMTGGEHSETTPHGARTSTTPVGNYEYPLDVVSSVTVNGANYVWRGTVFDRDLGDRIAEAITHPGFALLDVWDLCTAYFAPNNRLNKRTMEELRERLGWPAGLIHKGDRPEYTVAFREAQSSVRGKPLAKPKALEPKFTSSIDRKFHVVVAGSAGGRVRSSARALSVAGILSGLWASQRDDYPVTVKTGHSISEVILSPEPIRYTGIPKPDVLLLLSRDGLRKAGKYLSRLTAEDWFFTVPAFADLETPARKVVLDFKSAKIAAPARELALISIGAAVEYLKFLPTEALREALRASQRPEIAAANMKVLEKGISYAAERSL